MQSPNLGLFDFVYYALGLQQIPLGFVLMIKSGQSPYGFFRHRSQTGAISSFQTPNIPNH